MLVVASGGLLGALRGDLGDVIPGGAVASRRSRPDLAAEGARGPPRRLHGNERRGAKNITQTVVWRTGGPKVMETATYFEHPEMKRKIGSREGAPNTTLSYFL